MRVQEFLQELHVFIIDKLDIVLGEKTLFHIVYDGPVLAAVIG